MKTLTKKERRQDKLAHHYKVLEKLALLCGVSNPNGKKLSAKLFLIEQIAHAKATDYCNGVISTEAWCEIYHDQYADQVQALFNNNLQGLKINSDCRGYALKINDAITRTLYKDCGLHTDWGGYGILSPEINED